eukprot:m.51434 g.51434  ORF g.51434 m.51434 type:complete len:211 (+) comp18152_c3_seq1:1143-1775(+)
MQVEAVDPEGDTITYSLIDDKGIFRINSWDGTIRLDKSPVEAGLSGSFKLQVQATASRKSSIVSITINIQDACPCKNGGVCDDQFHCHCTPPFYGPTCASEHYDEIHDNNAGTSPVLIVGVVAGGLIALVLVVLFVQRVIRRRRRRRHNTRSVSDEEQKLITTAYGTVSSKQLAADLYPEMNSLLSSHDIDDEHDDDTEAELENLLGEQE